MAREHSLGRPRGNLLPKATQKEQPKPCMKFQMNVEHYKRTGEVIPLTEPEEFIPPEIENPFNVWASNQDIYNMEEEDMVKGKRVIEYKPTKAELEIDMKTMTNRQIAEKYGVSKSTAEKWIRDNGLQRLISIKKEDEDALLAIVSRKKDEETQVPETMPITTEEYEEHKESIIAEPTLAEREKFFTDTPAEYLAEHKAEMCVIEAEEIIWKGIASDLGILRQRMIQRAENEFCAKVEKLLESYR